MRLNSNKLKEIIKKLTINPKGILAADESESNIQAKFEPLKINNTPENRRLYREVLFTTKGIEEWISGIILHEETFSQNIDGSTIPQYLAKKGIIPGIKLDGGLLDAGNGEKITLGFDALEEKIGYFCQQGAEFAKWRAVYNISNTTPSKEILTTNAILLAGYASVCLKNGIIPIVEPEVLATGSHTITQCYDITEQVLGYVFKELKDKGIPLEFVILKPSMVLPGLDSLKKSATKEIAENTIRCLKANVPSEVGGVFFLSGGQSEEEATNNLLFMNLLGNLPWRLSFSYGRALQDSAIKTWLGNHNNIIKAQEILLLRAKANGLASIGKTFH